MTADLVIAARGRDEVPYIFSTCRSCDGRIVAQRTVIGTRYSGSWVHMHVEDWQERPHHAIPSVVGATTLAERMRRQRDR